MLLDFDYLVEKYKLDIKGVIHIGGHHGQEYSIYKKHNIGNIIMFEPVPSTFDILKNNLKDTNVVLINKALGNTTGKVSMNIETSNQGQSSSILDPVLHLQQYPHIQFHSKIEVDIMKLDDYNDVDLINYNFINMDTQGYEKVVLEGTTKTLEHIDYIMTEVNFAEVYKGCPLVEELDEFLKPYGFVRVETDKSGQTWGDSFYIKNHLLNQ